MEIYLLYDHRWERRGIVKVSQLDGNRVLVVLGDREMNDFALDFGAMGLSDPHTRKILLRLISLACRKSGIDTHGKRLSVEALQLDSDCYLLVTVSRTPQRWRLKRSGGIGFRFTDSTAFLNAVEALYRRRCLTKNTAYTFGGAYYLLFASPALPSVCKRILGEFAEKHGGGLFCARVRELGRVICPGNAVEIIGKHLV